MDAQLEHTAEVEISGGTKATLYLLGAFFAGAALLVLWKLIAALARPFQLAQPKQKRPAKPFAAHLQPRAAHKATPQTQSGNTSGGEASRQSIKHLLKQSKKQPHSSQAADAGSHSPLYLNTLKGHGDLVTGLGWSPDGRALATACEDRTIRVFDLSGSLTSSNVNFRRRAVTCGLVDVAFGQSANQLVVLTKGSLDAASLAMLDLNSNFSTMWELNNAHGGGAALTVDGCSRGVFATCGQKTDFKLFSSLGKQLAALDSSGLTNHGISLSAHGQKTFVAAATFTADVKIHEILFDRAGAFSKTAKVMDLKGHSRQVSAVAFSPDGRRAVTASQDHSLRVWNLDVRYQQQEDPKCLVNVQQSVPNGRSYEHLAYGAHGVIAASFERSVHMIDSASGAVVSIIEDAHTAVTYLQWSPVPRRIDGDEAYVLATGGDRRVRLWRST